MLGVQKLKRRTETTEEMKIWQGKERARIAATTATNVSSTKQIAL
jgi:hypothetical protein